jgi:2-polyprenyl-3-methyl-5-hydroxy-6-metoxy-1,4-benzoquinol methylase
MADDESPRGDAIAASWEANADAWTSVVREGRIPSRRAGTDAAVLDAVRRRPRGRLLDVGCGEGWLARALSAEGWTVTGTDGSAALVARAHELGGGEFAVVSYDDLVAREEPARGPFDVAVLNFALLDERIAPLLSAVARRLAVGGAIVVQTVHPWVAAGDGPYLDGWREETFSAFGDGRFPSPMPWYFRTLASWWRELHGAGLALERIDEPTDPSTGRPLSLLLTHEPSGRR